MWKKILFRIKNLVAEPLSWLKMICYYYLPRYISIPFSNRFFNIIFFFVFIALALRYFPKGIVRNMVLSATADLWIKRFGENSLNQLNSFTLLFSNLFMPIFLFMGLWLVAFLFWGKSREHFFREVENAGILITK